MEVGTRIRKGQSLWGRFCKMKNTQIALSIFQINHPRLLIWRKSDHWSGTNSHKSQVSFLNELYSAPLCFPHHILILLCHIDRSVRGRCEVGAPSSVNPRPRIVGVSQNHPSKLPTSLFTPGSPASDHSLSWKFPDIPIPRMLHRTFLMLHCGEGTMRKASHHWWGLSLFCIITPWAQRHI